MRLGMACADLCFLTRDMLPDTKGSPVQERRRHRSEIRLGTASRNITAIAKINSSGSLNGDLQNETLCIPLLLMVLLAGVARRPAQAR